MLGVQQRVTGAAQRSAQLLRLLYATVWRQRALTDGMPKLEALSSCRVPHRGWILPVTGLRQRKLRGHCKVKHGRCSPLSRRATAVRCCGAVLILKSPHLRLLWAKRWCCQPHGSLLFCCSVSNVWLHLESLRVRSMLTACAEMRCMMLGASCTRFSVGMRTFPFEPVLEIRWLLMCSTNASDGVTWACNLEDAVKGNCISGQRPRTPKRLRSPRGSALLVPTCEGVHTKRQPQTAKLPSLTGLRFASKLQQTPKPKQQGNTQGGEECCKPTVCG